MPLPPPNPKQSIKTMNVESNSAPDKGDVKFGTKIWFRLHWCWVVRIILAIIGVLVPLIMMLRPCEDVVTFRYEKEPVDLYVMMDASRSMSFGVINENDADRRWEPAIAAALNITALFSKEIPKLQIGVGLFAEVGRTIVEFTNDTEYAQQELSDLSFKYDPAVDGGNEIDGVTLGYGTSYYYAMDKFYQDFAIGQRPEAKSILLFISDGDPSAGDYRNSYEDWELARDMADAVQTQSDQVDFMAAVRGGFKPQGTEDSYIEQVTKTFSDHMTSYGAPVSSIGVMVKADANTNCDNRLPDRSPEITYPDEGKVEVECLYLVSSCANTMSYSDWKADNTACNEYLHFSNFNDFLDSTDEIVKSLEDKVGETVFSETECVKGPWLAFLALLLPLIIVALFPYCYNMKKTYVVKKMSPEKKSSIRVVPPPPPANKAEKTPSGKYKWDIKAHDQYLWSFKGGATPMKVDYAGQAPPSAPKDPSLERVKREVNTWEDADGVQNVMIEEERTFEQFTEDQLRKFGLTSCCFCCCPSYNPRNSAKTSKRDNQPIAVI